MNSDDNDATCDETKPENRELALMQFETDMTDVAPKFSVTVERQQKISDLMRRKY